ncbi:Ubiquitin fusion degradation protein 4 [Malassezia pachydermatis]
MPLDDEDEDDEGEENDGDEGPPFAALDVDHDGEDGEDDDDFPAGMLGGGIGLDLRSLRSLLSGNTSRPFRDMLTALQRSAHEPSMRLLHLQELAERLSVTTEDAFLGAFPMKGLVSELLWTLGGPEPEGHAVHMEDLDDEDLAAALAASRGGDDSEGEAKMYACRCLAYMIEALPESSQIMVRMGLIPLLIAQLHDITFIDLAEQVLQTLDKLAPSHATLIIREGGLLAALQYLDFFSAYVQRTAMSIVAQCATHSTPSMASHAQAIVPILQQVLGYADARLVESACRAVCAMTERFATDEKVLSAWLTPLLAPLLALLARGVGAVSNHLPTFSPPLYADLLRSLSLAATMSTALAHDMWEHGLLDTLYILLTGATDTSMHVPQRALLQNLAQRPPMQIEAALRLLRDVLPQLPVDGIFDARSYSEKAYQQKRRRAEREGCEMGELDASLDEAPVRRLSAAALKQQRATEARADAQRAWPHFFENYATLMLPVFLDVYTALGAEDARHKILEVVLALLWYADVSTLGTVLEPLPLASFLTSILGSHEQESYTEAALQAVELLLLRLPYAAPLLREGTAWEVEQLAKAEPPHYRAKLVYERWRVWPADTAFKEAQHIQASLARLAERLKSSDALAAMDDVAAMLPRTTSFELQRAGMMEALYVCATSPAHPCELEARREKMRSVLSVCRASLWTTLHENLNHLADMPVVSAGGVASLTKQVRLRLEADEATARRLPRHFSSFTVSIHAIVTTQALHDFLKPKLELVLSSQGKEGLSGMLAALAAASGTPANSSQPESEDNTNDDEDEDEATQESSSKSYAAAAQSPSSAWHLSFRVNDVPMPLNATVYHCIPQTTSDEAMPTITYTLVRGAAPPVPPVPSPPRMPRSPGYEVALPPSVPTSAPYARTLQLLGALRDLWDDQVSDDDLVNTRLTAKLNQQLQEPLILASEAMPAWVKELPHTHSFLFAFETRLQYLRRTSLGYARMLSQFKQSSADEVVQALAQVPRQKVRIARDNLLPSAVKVLDLYSRGSSILEIEYFDEVGSGMGPTLEFYALVSKALQRVEVGMWRHDSHTESEYVSSPHGLFPMVTEDKDVVRLFRTLGQLVAKSLVDARIIDVPFHPLFWRAVLGRRVPCTLATLGSVDPALETSLSSLLRMPTDEVAALSLEPCFPGTDCVLPGWDQNTPIDGANIKTYVDAVITMALQSGIEKQLDAFRDGIAYVLPLSALDVFQSKELVVLFGQSQEDWDEATLLRTVVPDHGFTSDSTHFKDLLAILASFSLEERRTFLQWLTGSPRLPVGGFTALQPPLTVVRRLPDAPLQPDDYLPSVMTCVNYLKLPCYSSREKMKERLWTAMHEGLTSFHLS